MRPLLYLFFVLLGLGATHLAWSAGVVATLHAFFQHRAPNLAKMAPAGDPWEQLASGFSRRAMDEAHRSGKPLVMLLGSSMTYGYPWQEPVIYSRLMADALPGSHVVNLSMVGARMRSLTDFALCALDGSHRPAVLLVEIPLINSVASVKAEIGRIPRACAWPGARAPADWQVALSHPMGTGWIALLWDEEAYSKPDEPLQVSRVPPDYFADRQAFAPRERAFVAELRRYLKRTGGLGDRVYAYVSPIYTGAITAAGGDLASVEHQIALTLQVCAEVKTVICLDTRPIGTRKELFYNLTHLNQRGHRAMADFLVAAMAQQQAAAAPAR
jgi:hypothetical protein